MQTSVIEVHCLFLFIYKQYWANQRQRPWENYTGPCKIAKLIKYDRKQFKSGEKVAEVNITVLHCLPEISLTVDYLIATKSFVWNKKYGKMC